MQEIQNISMIDRLVRHTIGWAMILSVLEGPIAPTWLAAVAIYPCLTATLGWDPLYHVLRDLAPKRPTSILLKQSHAM